MKHTIQVALVVLTTISSLVCFAFANETTHKPSIIQNGDKLLVSFEIIEGEEIVSTPEMIITPIVEASMHSANHRLSVSAEHIQNDIIKIRADYHKIKGQNEVEKTVKYFYIPLPDEIDLSDHVIEGSVAIRESSTNTEISKFSVAVTSLTEDEVKELLNNKSQLPHIDNKE